MFKKIIDIIDMDLRGRGIGRDNGKAVFVDSAVTGDKIECVTEISKKRYDVARLTNIIEPSPLRCESECPVFSSCGGCSFMNITREAELNVKTHAVETAFKRATITDVSVNNIIHGNSYGYRNKAVFHKGLNGKYGFFASGSHNISTGDCVLVPDTFNKIIRYVESKDPTPESIMIRSGNGDIMVAVQVTAFGECDLLLNALHSEFKEIKSLYECIGYPTSAEARFRHYSGDKYIVTDFCGIRLRVSPKSFFQINSEIAEQFCNEISKNLSPKKGDVILDLYCGIGTIGLTLAKHFPDAYIIGVEINESAVTDAEYNSSISNIENAKFICGDAGKACFDRTPYAIVVDPPRYGLTDSMIKTILEIKPDHLVYMSCDPGTLAGDSSKLITGGYRICGCTAGDMFPRCPHVETIVFFTRDN